jgi:Rnl2 family RNA ligase
MPKEFAKYPSIKNTSCTKLITKIMQTVPKDMRWIATEKIDGANISVIYRGGKVLYGRREDLLSEHEMDTFCGTHKITFRELMNDCQPKFNRIYKAILLAYPGAYEVQFYGELVGAIRNRVYYGDKFYFYGFDIKVDEIMLEYEDMCAYYANHDIFYARPLFSGTLVEMLKLNTEKPSTIYRDFDRDNILPESFGENIMEGYVLRTEDNCTSHGNRCMLKLKSNKFCDKTPKYIPIMQKSVDWSDEMNEYFNILNTYNTKNRIIDMKSKLGTDTNIDKIIGLVIKEIINEAADEHCDSLPVMNPKEIKKVYARLSESVRELYTN